MSKIIRITRAILMPIGVVVFVLVYFISLLIVDVIVFLDMLLLGSGKLRETVLKEYTRILRKGTDDA